MGGDSQSYRYMVNLHLAEETIIHLKIMGWRLDRDSPLPVDIFKTSIVSLYFVLSFSWVLLSSL